MSHRPTIVSLHVEARILLTTVAGRSSMDRMAEGIEHMVIETLLFIAVGVIVGAAVVKAYEWHHDGLYGPYNKGRPMKQRPRGWPSVSALRCANSPHGHRLGLVAR